MNYENQGYQPDDPEVALGEALEHLHLALSIEMRRLRKREGLTQGQLGERMGVSQSTVSKLESANVHSDFESLLRYLSALDADLVLGILDEGEFLPVSEAAEDWCAQLDLAGDDCSPEEDTSSLPPKQSPSHSWQMPDAERKTTSGSKGSKVNVISIDTAATLSRSGSRGDMNNWKKKPTHRPERQVGDADIENGELIVG